MRKIDYRVLLCEKCVGGPSRSEAEKSLFFGNCIRFIDFSGHFRDLCRVPVDDFLNNHDFGHCFEHERDAIRSTDGLEALSLCLYETSALQKSSKSSKIIKIYGSETSKIAKIQKQRLENWCKRYHKCAKSRKPLQNLKMTQK